MLSLTILKLSLTILSFLFVSSPAVVVGVVVAADGVIIVVAATAAVTFSLLIYQVPLLFLFLLQLAVAFRCLLYLFVCGLSFLWYAHG